MVDHALSNSPRVGALLIALSARGCSVRVECADVFGGAPALAAYEAVAAEEAGAGARAGASAVGGAGGAEHVSGSGGRVLMNPAVPPRYLTQHQWTRGMAHELVHAFDDCRADMRQDDARHMACTEVRAANLSGDCDFGDELRRGGPRWRLAGLQRECVRKRAHQSLVMHAACEGWTPAAVTALVDDVFPVCYADTAPFATN